MINTTRWSPDTCKCVIEYDWDDSVSEEERTHVTKLVTKCEVHNSIEDIKDVHQTVEEESSRRQVALKNARVPEVMHTLTEEEKDLIHLILQSKGENISIPNEVLKRGVEIRDSFDENRNLVIEVIGTSKENKDTISSLISNSKVKVI